MAELETVLRLKFRHWLIEEEADRFIADVRVLADMVADPAASPDRQTDDPKDEYLVALSRVADVVALISGYPHLTELVDLYPPVLTPAAYLERLEG